VTSTVSFTSLVTKRVIIALADGREATTTQIPRPCGQHSPVVARVTSTHGSCSCRAWPCHFNNGTCTMFSGVHLHLLVNHAPLFGALFALALLAASFLWAPDVLRRSALVVLVFTAFAAAASDLTGEPAEDAIRGFPGVRREVIHDHEEMGEKSYIASIILGVLAVGALLRWRRAPLPQGAAVGAFVGAAVVSGMMAYTSLLGGRVRHTEVRPGATDADAITIEPRRQRPGAPDSAQPVLPAQP
jgi:hypothetical protein